MSRRPVYSKFHLIRIQCESSFVGVFQKIAGICLISFSTVAPTEVYMTGPSLALPGDLLSFSCNSDEVKFESELSEVFQNMKF